MGLELLCTADVHLGQRTHRLPVAPGEPGAEWATPTATWHRLIDLARERRPDAVLLAGDVVDAANAFFEAYGPLAEGVRTLIDLGIPVLAVAGNHDHEVLGRLADEIPAFRLLGRGGCWEEAELRRGDEVVATVCGWSFPTPHHRDSPLRDLPPPARPDLPRLGLLHCDVDVAGSRYAPVTTAELKAAPVRAWILGHQHVPQERSPAAPLIRYCGALQGLDPTETGLRGPCWLRLDERGELDAALVPLAGLRWEELEVPLDGVDDLPGVEAAVLAALRTSLEAAQDQDDRARIVGCRLRLTGRTRCHGELEAWIQDERKRRTEISGVLHFIDRIDDCSAPELDLEEMARGRDPVGLVAARLLCLERGEPADQYQELLAAGRRHLRTQLDRRRHFAALDPPPALNDTEVHDLLRRASLRLLDNLRATRRST